MFPFRSADPWSAKCKIEARRSGPDFERKKEPEDRKLPRLFTETGEAEGIRFLLPSGQRRGDDGHVVDLFGVAAAAEVGVECARCAKIFGIDPQVAFLSFSTKGSGKGGSVALSAEATKIAKELAPELNIDGEMQFDAAVAPEVGQLKFPGSPVAGQANTFIFPQIESGNIGYKIAQRLGGYDAYGPILQGLNAPINDLSRGCNAEEVYKMAIITAGMA